MLSTIKPLLCRHDFYWSERHRSERCRRCGKLSDVVETATDAATPQPLPGGDAALQTVHPPEQTTAKPLDEAPVDEPSPPPASPQRRPAASVRVLRAQARQRREGLLDMIEHLAAGREPSREEALDAVLAVIEDAHSADPVLFGEQAAAHLARLHDARTRLAC
ncbi:hypothetical protein [Brevundimonas sp. FT23042]|uniref:hypothetical protein n=1 Tax=Brevundimonas sp. FT23042 TaxID=3393749 RepID=UPI003B58A19B